MGQVRSRQPTALLQRQTTHSVNECVITSQTECRVIETVVGSVLVLCTPIRLVVGLMVLNGSSGCHCRVDELLDCRSGTNPQRKNRLGWSRVGSTWCQTLIPKTSAAFPFLAHQITTMITPKLRPTSLFFFYINPAGHFCDRVVFVHKSSQNIWRQIRNAPEGFLKRCIMLFHLRRHNWPWVIHQREGFIVVLDITDSCQGTPWEEAQHYI